MAKGNQFDFQLLLPEFLEPTDQIRSEKSQSPPLAHWIPFFVSYQLYNLDKEYLRSWKVIICWDMLHQWI
ncbi:Hypothetical predicted protein [Olea europaea subsp. europaea]|uniref:Uncharacterized protein n=1 Tax=Olea europaea subsp. europaea TaxID=158383 RepID=A0A8S0PBJ2_OLEEU|nr:Hypothetical predicted protein [Olea europaea subsp. europaea]